MLPRQASKRLIIFSVAAPSSPVPTFLAYSTASISTQPCSLSVAHNQQAPAEASHAEQLHKDILHPGRQGGVLCHTMQAARQRTMGCASSSSCRRLQKATCTAKTLLDLSHLSRLTRRTEQAQQEGQNSSSGPSLPVPPGGNP